MRVADETQRASRCVARRAETNFVSVSGGKQQKLRESEKFFRFRVDSARATNGSQNKKRNHRWIWCSMRFGREWSVRALCKRFNSAAVERCAANSNKTTITTSFTAFVASSIVYRITHTRYSSKKPARRGPYISITVRHTGDRSRVFRGERIQSRSGRFSETNIVERRNRSEQRRAHCACVRGVLGNCAPLCWCSIVL